MEGGDYIYAISEKGITAHNVATMEQTGFAELPSNNKPSYVDYYYEDVVDAIEVEPEEDSEKEEDESEDSGSTEEGEGEAPPEEDSS